MTKENMGMKRLACIDVGSGALEMILVETDGESVRVLETLRKDIALGRDCYKNGIISRALIQDTCVILKGFRELAESYHADATRIVATSAIREAKNRDWVLDQIRLSTGFEVSVLTNEQERAVMLGALFGVPDYARLQREGVLIVDVGYGSTEISEIRGGELILTRNVKVGALRLWELISSIADNNPQYPQLLEEYIAAELTHIRELVKLDDIRHCVALSGEAELLIGMMEAHPTLKRYNHLYVAVKSMTPEQMERTYGVPRERAEILLPTMMVMKAFIEMTRAEALNLYGVTLKDGIISHMRAEQFKDNTLRKALNKGRMSMARALAASQGADMRHARDVERKAVVLFDALKPLHGMSGREKLLLRLAATLHDMGKSLSTHDHGVQSAYILRANPIIGLSEEDHAVVAFILENHGMNDMMGAMDKYVAIGEKGRVAAVKLLALLVLADAMDAGYRQKLTLLSVAIEANRVVLLTSSSNDAMFEKWIFGSKSQLFQEVFGIGAELKVKMIV